MTRDKVLANSALGPSMQSSLNPDANPMSPNSSNKGGFIKKRWVRNSEGRWVAEQGFSPDQGNAMPFSHEKDSQYSGDYTHHMITGKNILD